MTRPDTLKDVAAAEIEGHASFRTALVGFLDTFYMQPERRQAMIDPDPGLLGKPEIDAYLGAVGEHLARRWGLKIPKWTSNAARTLREPFFATSIEALKPMLLAQSPLAFRKRMIFVEHEPLSRARMPKTKIGDSGPPP